MVSGGTISGMTDDRAGRAHAGLVPSDDEQWQVEGGAAGRYQAHLVPAVTAGWAAGLVDRVGVRRGERAGSWFTVSLGSSRLGYEWRVC